MSQSDSQLYIHNSCFTIQSLPSNQSNPHISNHSIQHQQPKKSPYYLKYISFFAQVELQATNKIQQYNNSQQAWKEHRIIMNQQYLHKRININGFVKPLIQIVDISHYGAVVNYFIYIFKYRISIKLLHTKNQQCVLKTIGEGGYGQICQIQLQNHNKIISKRNHFTDSVLILNQQKLGKKWSITPKKSQIEMVLYQYAFYRLSSFFKIGPALFSKFGYDLICFQNYIQFYMELCLSQSSLKKESFSYETKLALRILHKLKIIHKDIKNNNILFSPTYNKYVLIDFGISHEISEQVGQQSLTYKQGTPGYICGEMAMIKSEPRYIDIYYNDLFGLKIAIERNGVRVNNKVRMDLNKKCRQKESKYEYRQGNIFYEGMIVVGGIINCDQKILLNLSEKQQLLKNKSISQIMDHFERQQIKRPIQMINISKIQNINIVNIIQRNFKDRVIKQFKVSQIEFLIRTYGINRKLLSYANQFTNFKFKNTFIQKLRQIQIYDQNQHKIQYFANKYDKNRQIKSLQRQLKYLTQSLLTYYTQTHAIQFSHISLLLFIKHKIKLSSHFYHYFHQLNSLSLHQPKIILLNCLYNITQNQSDKHLFSQYIIKRNFILPIQQQLKIWFLLKEFYKKIKLYSKQKQYIDKINNCSINTQAFLNQNPTQFQKHVFFQQFQNIYKIAQFYQYKKAHISIILSCFYKSLEFLIFFQNSNQFIKVINQIAVCFKYLKKNDIFQALSQIAMHSYKQNNFEIQLDIYWNMAQCNYLKNNVQIANKYLEKSLQIAIKNYGPQHLSTAIYYTSIGYFCLKNNDLQKAEFYCKMGLQIVSLQRSQQNYIYITILEILACIYHYTKRKDSYKKIYEQCLKKKIIMFGEYDIQIVKTLNGLAISTYDEKNYNLRIQNAQKSIEICKIMKYNTRQIVQSYGILAVTYFYLNQLEKMKDAMEQQLNMAITYFGENNKYLAYACSHHGKYFWAFKNYEKALYWYNRSINIKQRQFGKDHFDMIHDFIESGYCHFELRQFKKAKLLLKKSKKIMDTFFGKDHIRYVDLCMKLGECYIKTGNYMKGVYSLRILLKYCEMNIKKEQNYIFNIVQRLDEWYDKYYEMRLGCLNSIYLYNKYVRMIGQRDDRYLLCVIRINECYGKLYIREKKRKLYDKIKIEQVIQFDDERYFEILYGQILKNIESILILKRIIRKGCRNKDMYIRILKEMQKKQGYELVQILQNERLIRIKSKNNLELLKMLKKLLKLNRKYYYRSSYQQNLHKIIISILKQL